MRLARRIVVVCLIAGGIVAAGWSIKQIDPVYAYFQKSGSPDSVQGDDRTAGSERPEDVAKADSAERTGDASRSGDEGGFAGNESMHPTGDDAKQGSETAHERWPALQFNDAGHAALFMLPTAGAVIAIDKIRRMRRQPLRPLTHHPT